MVRFKNDDGYALPTVLGAIALMTVIALGGYFVAENTLVDAKRVSGENRAYQAASSALEQEMAVFEKTLLSSGQSKSGYAYGTKQSINGSDWFTVDVLDSTDNPAFGPDEFEMVAVGGSANTTECVRVRFMSFNLWEMNVAAGDDSAVGSGAGLNGNGRIIGKVYCNGNFEWTGSAILEEGPIFVKNGVFDKQSTASQVGDPSQPVDAYLDNPPVGQTSNMYVEQKGSAPTVTIKFPTTADLAERRAEAIRDSLRNKLGNGTAAPGVARHPDSRSDAEYNVFEGNLTLGGLTFGKPGTAPMTGSIDETSSGDVLAVNGNTLYVNGVTYIDGALTISSDIYYYAGRGTLVARDGITINGRLVPVDYDTNFEPHDGEKMPLLSNSNCLGLYTPGDVTQNVNGWVTAAVFAGGKFTATGAHSKFRGSIIANGMDFLLPGQWLVTHPKMAEYKPPGMPDLDNLNARQDWFRE